MPTAQSAREFYAAEIESVANLQSASLVKALASVQREAFLGPAPGISLLRTLAAPDQSCIAKRRMPTPVTSITTFWWPSIARAS